MAVHKFITKRPPVRYDPPAIKWRIGETAHMATKVNSTRWEIYMQEDTEIKPISSYTLILNFGVQMTKGVCLISLRQEIKAKGLSLHDGIVSEDTDNIIVTLQNNSETLVTMRKGDSLCYINHHI